MRKVKLVLLTSLSFVVMVGIIISCNKKNDSMHQPESSLNPTNAVISSTIDLENFETKIKTNADGSKIITFSEPEDIDFDPTIASALGFNKLVISKGIYTINVTSSGISTLVFPIMSYDGVGALGPVQSSIFDSGIRIARRHSHHKDCTKADCLCGVGFRCGFHRDRSGTQFATPGNILVIRDGNNVPTSLRITFDSPEIDWESLH